MTNFTRFVMFVITVYKETEVYSTLLPNIPCDKLYKLLKGSESGEWVGDINGVRFLAKSINLSQINVN